MANLSTTQLSPLTDRIPLSVLFQHVNECFGYLATEVLEEKVFGGDIRTWVRWHSGSQPAWLLYGNFGDFFGEEAATPELLKRLCQGMGFRRLLDDDGIYAGDNKTAFVVASRGDAARFWPWSEALSQPGPTAQIKPQTPEPAPSEPESAKSAKQVPAKPVPATPAAKEPSRWVEDMLVCREPNETAEQFAVRMEPLMRDAFIRREVKGVWVSRSIQNHISKYRLWTK